ncbi:hypothetical protein CWO08_08385 [Vibrio sp. 10N.286.48.B8]|uniref:O-antigen polymerase n=1 Tax=Vibrio sp. 10N.286.48.B8 TaxID=2056189 RepID=UPI000D35A994|nr:O-antigen polymerase [Vibrio sp. 10N.286.48.B8]PTO96259.1 hypothetical protein CWO08_08385 [Vibrio sp. 10N.286.48.B8]
MVAPIYWLLFWFMLAVVNPLSLVYSPNESYLYIYMSILLFVVGNISSKKHLILLDRSYLSREEDNLNRIASKLVLIIGPIIGYLSFKAVHLISTMPLYAYRRTVYTEPELLMGIKQLFPLFQLFIEGGILLLLLIAFQQLFYSKNKKLIIYCFFFACIFSIIFLGRYSIYRILVLSLIFSLSFSKDLKSIGKTVLISFLVGSMLIGFSIYRSNGLFGITQVFIKHIIGYHSFGFSLFEYYYTNSAEYISRTWLGGSLFGSISYIIFKPIDAIFNIGSYLQSQDYISQDNFIYLGTYMVGEISVDLLANAFYTLFTDLYRDFSWLGVFLFYPIGRFTTYLQDRVRLEDPIAILTLMYLIFILTFMIMKNPFVRHEIFLPTIYVIYKVIITKKNFKYV